MPEFMVDSHQKTLIYILQACQASYHCKCIVNHMKYSDTIRMVVEMPITHGWIFYVSYAITNQGCKLVTECGLNHERRDQTLSFHLDGCLHYEL